MARIELRRVSVSLATGESYGVPYWQVSSGVPGPHLLVTAALHGNEVHGSEVLRCFVDEAAAGLVLGSCTLVPVANPIAVRRRQPHIDFELGRYYGSDRENNVNCSWNGAVDGTNAQRLSHALFGAVVEEATHCIDLHCWPAIRAATVLPRLGNEVSMGLAQATAIRFVRASAGRAGGGTGPVFPCTLGGYFNDSGRAAVAIELCGQSDVSECQVELGVRALRNCCRFLGLLPGEAGPRGMEQVRVDTSEEVNVRTDCAGLFVKGRGLALGQLVGEGDALGHVFRDDTLATETVRASSTGYLFGLGSVHDDRKGEEHQLRYFHPYVHAGETVATLIVPGER